MSQGSLNTEPMWEDNPWFEGIEEYTRTAHTPTTDREEDKK